MRDFTANVEPPLVLLSGTPAYWVCVHTVPTTHTTQGEGVTGEAVCKNKSLVHRVCSEGSRFWFLLVSKALLKVPGPSVLYGSAHLAVHAQRADSQPRQKPGASLIVCRDGAVSGVVVKSVEVFAALWAEIKGTCKMFQKLVFHP